ncbi:DUF1963 domain-containing protein [Maribacter chungangensis]|uniref:DUF1963 domain-containing protein n=1 Tax=Maribacter chungangensis TaxID=1069117 RepID=A0ABW3AZY8_9FLAO
MKTLTTPILELQLPDDFKITYESKIGLRAEDDTTDCKVQHPHVEARLFESADLKSDAYKGDTLAEKWEDWCISLNYKSELIRFEETEFKGYTCFIVHSHTDAAWNDLHFKLQYFQAAVFLDDTYFLEFKTIHEKIPSNELDNWVMQVFESLVILGDTATRKQAYSQHVLDTQVDYKKILEAQRTKQEQQAEEKKNSFRQVQIPKDEKEVFKVGIFDFEFVPKETKISIGAMSRDIQLTLKAKTKAIEQAIKTKVLDDYPGDGTVTLTFPAKGLHLNGQPQGQLYFEEEKTNAPLFLNARNEGFDYRLAFCGSLTFDNGWVLLKGEMTKSYHDKAFPIFVAKKLDMSALNWADYRFSSMEETATAHPTDVRFLTLQNPSFTALPEALFGFTNLEELTLHQKANVWDEEKLPFKVLQPELGQLSKLKKLHISGTSVEQVPESIGQLTQLEQLSINNNLVEQIPDAIWQLPKLKFLWLSANKLTSIPENIDLPSLQNISLDKNDLATLPESLAKQPQLKRIKLNGNPLASLPDAFNAIKEIDLSIEDKLRLLDFGYKGADGTGLTDWDDTHFWAQHDEELVAEVDAVIKNNKLEEFADALRPMVKKAIGFKHQATEDYAQVGNHRFGGMPDLPKTVPYPRFGENWRKGKLDYIYEFIGQINCEAVAHLQDYLPRTGTLFFFLETMHNIYAGDINPGKIIYVEDNTTLVSGQRFQFTEDDYFEMMDSGYEGFKVDATKINSAPSLYASYVNKHLFTGKSEVLLENDKLLDTLYDRFEKPLNDSFAFDYAVNAHGFTQHEAPELQASLAKKGNPEDWVALLVVTSAGDMQWGDAGDIFYVIHKSDLAKLDFSNVFVTLESS